MAFILLAAPVFADPVLPNDPRFVEQWALHNTGQEVNGVQGISDCDIDAPEAWAIEDGSSHDVVIAIIDTGVDYNHPDLKDNIWINEEEDRNHNGKFDNWLWSEQHDGVYGDLDGVDDDNPPYGNGFVDDVIGLSLIHI